MTCIVGFPGSVAWAGSTNNAQLATTGTEPVLWTLEYDGEEFETTAFAGTGAQTTFIKGLTRWLGTFESTLKAPEHGALGLVTFTAGYTAQLNAWTMEITRDALQATVFGATEHAFLPGLCKIEGTFSGYVDDTTVLTAPANSSEPATGTFKYSERTTTDATLSGSIFTKQLGVRNSPGEIATASYSYRLSGALTQSTPTSGVTIVKTGTFDPTLDVASNITLNADATRNYQGSAFWTRIGISVAVGQLTRVNVGFQGTGALSIN